MFGRLRQAIETCEFKCDVNNVRTPFTHVSNP